MPTNGLLIQQMLISVGIHRFFCPPPVCFRDQLMDIVMIYRALCCILLWTISSFAMSSQSLDTPLQELEVGNLKGVVFYGKYNYSTGAAILELHPVVLFDQMMTEDLSVLVSGQD